MNWKSNKLTELKDQYIDQLSAIYSTSESRKLFFVLTEYFFGIDQIHLALEPDKRISESEMLVLHKAVKELLNHKPIQYVTGVASFFDMNLKVNESVLIPRPETEELVQLILQKEKKNHPAIIDIGTGSGCIALAIKKNMTEARVTAVDISIEALNVVRQNMQTHQVDIELLQMDILSPASYTGLSVFDVVVSNPPYVTQSDKEKMQKNVLDYEPAQALFVDDDQPLIYYEAIVQFCQKHLISNGRIYFEINEQKGSEVVRLMKENDYKKVMLHNDMHGKERFATAVKS